MGLRMLCAAATGAAAGLLLFVPAASGRTEYASDVCIDAQPAYTLFLYSDPGTVVTHNEHCKPVSPPDSQRQVTVSLVDPSANPTSKLLYFRIRVDCGGATSCSKNIPQLDPLATGGYARMLEADMTLVDDDAP